MFNITTLGFDDNKILKCQLDMLIFVQVCRTIVKNYNSSIGSERTNESNEIYEKEAYVARFKTESEDKYRLRTIRSCLPELDVIRESEEPQKLEFIMLEQRVFHKLPIEF